MKTGRTIQEMAVELQRQSEAKSDYLVNTGRLQMAVWDGQPMLHLLGEGGEDQMEPLEVLTTAHRQLGTYLNAEHDNNGQQCVCCKRNRAENAFVLHCHIF